MKCDTVKELFSDYLESKMERPLALTFDQHLEECATCRLEYVEFRSIWGALDNLPEVVPPHSFRRQVMARVVQERTAAPRRAPVWSFNWGNILSARVPARAFAAGFVLLLFVALAVQIGQQPAAIKGGGALPGIKQDWPVSSNDLGRGHTGLRISVSPISELEGQSFQIRVEPGNTDVSDVKFYLLAGGQPSFTRSALAGATRMDIPIFEGRPVLVRSGPGTAYMEWYYRGERFSEAVFMPEWVTHLPSAAANVDLPDTTIYGALSKISETYGIVIIADADLGMVSIDTIVTGATAEQALDEVLAVVGGRALGWKKSKNTVYSVSRD